MDERARLLETMAGHTGRGTVPGLVMAVARGDEVHVDALGGTALDGGGPMRPDTIFRIASMTKPVVAVAAMTLVEDGVLRLDEPVDRLLPELAARPVLARPDGPLDDTVPARRRVTVEDLLTFRCGFGIDMDIPFTAPVLQAAGDLELQIGAPLPRTPHGPDEWMRRYASLPLMAQPGERWLYDTPADVLGVLVARAAGRPLDALLRERVLDPLGMADTGFSVPPARLHRLATSYGDDPDTGELVVHDGVEDSQWREPPAFPSGGGGLVSTVGDYVAFGRMLADGGRYPGGRLLSPETVRLMTTDQLAPEQHGSLILGGRGWGLGMAVSTAGTFGWDGGLGTSWLSDRHGGVAVLLTQRAFSEASMPVFADFREQAGAVLAAPALSGAPGAAR